MTRKPCEIDDLAVSSRQSLLPYVRYSSSHLLNYGIVHPYTIISPTYYSPLSLLFFPSVRSPWLHLPSSLKSSFSVSYIYHNPPFSHRELSLIVSLSILNIIIYIILFPIQSPIYIISLSVFYLIRSSPVFKSPFLNPIHSVSSRSNPSFSVPVPVTFSIFSLSYTLKYIILYPHHHLSFPLSFLFSTYHKSYKISPKYSIYSSSFSYIH